MKTRIKEALLRTWDYIADDALCLYCGKMRRNDVIEMVLDADRLKTHGKDKEAVEAFWKMNETKRETFLKTVFKSEWYCR